MLKDDEINVIALGRVMADRLNADFEADLEDCEALDGHRWEKRNLLRKGMESLAGLFRQEV